MKGRIWIGFQAFIICCFLPFFLGQQDCEIDQRLKDMLEDKFIKKNSTGQQVDTYVTHMSFMDAQTKGIMVQTEAAALINGAVVDGMQKAAKANTALKINQTGHAITNTEGNVNKLVNFIFDPAMTPEDKINAIITNMMDPASVDVIVSGQYIDEAKNPTIQVRPFIIVKDGKKLLSKNLQYNRENFLCDDPVNKGVKVLCQQARDEITQSIKDLLDSI